jgi:peptidoglycan/LPS O-acetylase OafA/YrhL
LNRPHTVIREDSPAVEAERPRLNSFFALIRLRRITSSLKYVPEIDGIRFIAILSVIIYHLSGDIYRHSTPEYLRALGSNGLVWLTGNLNFGVQMFFVLSGYVLALPFAGQLLGRGPRVSLWRYFRRRLTRLEPPYILILIIFFWLKVLGGRGTVASLWPHLLASVFYVHNQVYGEPSSIDFVAWSLEIEVQFYILAPFIAALLYRPADAFARRIGILVAMMLSAYIASLGLGDPRIDNSLIGQLPYFLAGFLLADLRTLEPSVLAGRVRWDLVGLAALALPYILMYWQLPILYFAPLIVATAYYSIFHSVALRRFLRLALVSTIGGMCYTIYLVHNYVIALCGMYTERFGAGYPFAVRLCLQAAMILPVVLIVSTVLFVLIERPCMQPDWPTRLWAKLGFIRDTSKITAAAK